MGTGRVALLLAVLVAAAPVEAEDAAPAPPATPAVVPTVGYAGPDAVAARLAALAREHPGLVRIETYGQSAGGRPLLLARVGKDTLPLVFVHGGLGRRDAAGTAAALHLLERLVRPSPDATGPHPSLERVSYAIVPAPNPDALAAFLGKARWTLGGPSLDRDNDGRTGEDGPDDLDGDGEVLWMRRRLPDGPLAVDDAPEKDGKVFGDPRLLRDAGADARRAASWSRPVEEGRDEDGDGEVDEDAPGTDLVRNLVGVWEEMGAWSGDGPFPGSAPETHALLERSWAAGNLVGWYGFASEGPRLERASERGADADADDALYGVLGPTWVAAAGGVPLRKASERPGAGGNPGSDLDWAARHLGVVALRVPVWRIAKEERNGRERADPDDLDWLLWNDRVLGGRGFVAWHGVKHPTFGEVDVGGWRPFTRHEPPPDLLGAAVASVALVPAAHAEAAPRLEVRLETTRVAPDVLRVKARVANLGGGPTETKRAEAAKRAMAVRLDFAPVEGSVLLAGPRSTSLGTLAAGAFSTEVEWLVRVGRPGAAGRVTASHRVAGEASAEVKAP
jgi:hypothetical protein